MIGRINRCSHCGCDEPINNAIDVKLYCNNCGMSLESTLPSHAQASKLEGGLTMTNGDWLRSKGDKELAEFIMAAELFVIQSGKEGKTVIMQSILDLLKEEHKEG